MIPSESTLRAPRGYTHPLGRTPPLAAQLEDMHVARGHALSAHLGNQDRRRSFSLQRTTMECFQEVSKTESHGPFAALLSANAGPSAGSLLLQHLVPQEPAHSVPIPNPIFGPPSCVRSQLDRLEVQPPTGWSRCRSLLRPSDQLAPLSTHSNQMRQSR